MDDFLTYMDISLSFAEILYLEKIDISENTNEHAKLKLTAILDSDKNIFYQIPEFITLFYDKDNKKRPLYSGIITKSSMKREGSHFRLVIEAKGLTYLMDIQHKIHSFQDVTETSHQIIDYITMNYPGCMCKKNMDQYPIGQLLFQYEETDWNFLKRLSNKYGLLVYPDALSEQMSVQIGCSPILEEADIDENFFICSQKFGDYEHCRANMVNQLMPQQYISYEIETYGIIPLGALLTYKKQKWCITSIKRNLKNGLLVNTYVLAQKEAEISPRYFNKMLPGISFEGNVTNVRRNKVQVMIQNDLNSRNCGQYWFPYSTVSESPDGSGWYCMPEPGEKVRVYFPTDDENDVYVISNLSGHTSNSKGKINPSIRHISTAQGNIIKFTESGISISVKGDAANIILGKSGGVSISASKSISIFAGNQITMEADTISTDAENEIEISNTTGASLFVDWSRISIAAKKIYQN